jgi:hypothetical protein
MPISFHRRLLEGTAGNPAARSNGASGGPGATDRAAKA